MFIRKSIAQILAPLFLTGCSWVAAPAAEDSTFLEAAAQAAKEHKLAFVNFTGYACTNCPWMKAMMFARQCVKSTSQSNLS